MTKEIKHKHRLRFNEWSKSYDRSILQHIVFNTSHNMFFNEMKRFAKDGMRVLDVGCGTGKFAFRLSDFFNNARVDGVDLSDSMIKKAKAKLKDEPINFRIGDVEHLPYDEETFDVITCSHSFHHYPNQLKAVTEMHRVLKHDGRLMIVDGCRDNLLGKIIFDVVTIVEGHVYHVFEREMRDMLLQAGFDKVMQKRFNPVAPLLFTLGQAKKKKGEE